MNELEAMALAAAAKKRKQEAAAQMTAGDNRTQPQSFAGDTEAKRRKLRLLQKQARIIAKTTQGKQPTNERTLGDILFDNIVGRDDGVNSYGEKLGTFLNKTGESFAFGYVGDETSAAAESLLPGVDFEERRDHYRQQELQFEEQHPLASFIAELAPLAIPATGVANAAARGTNLGLATLLEPF